MPHRSILSSIKPLLVLLCLSCAFFSSAQKPVDVLFSPVSTLDGTEARVSSINILSDSIVFVQVDVVPNRDFESLPNGISPNTVLSLGNRFYPMNNVAQIMPDSMFPIQNTDGFQGWYDAKANDVYHLLLTFIVPSLTSTESFSILPSDSESVAPNDSGRGYFSFPDISINSASVKTTKAIEATLVKSTRLLSEPSSKARKLEKLQKGEKVCILGGGNSDVQDLNTSSSEFYHIVVLSSGVNGYVEKSALSTEGNPLEYLTDAIKLSKVGDKNEKSEVAEIECHNQTLSPVTIAFNKATVTIDPLKTQTFRLRILPDKGKTSEEGFQYLVVHSEGLPPMVIRCKLSAGDSYHWDIFRATSF